MKNIEFKDVQQTAIEEEFLSRGYIIRRTKRKDIPDEISQYLLKKAVEFLKKDLPENPQEFFLNAPTFVELEQLNPLRIYLFQQLNAMPSIRSAYFHLAKEWIESLLGNELVMQNRVNLSIQCPRNTSSINPIHADSFSGESLFQMVLWIPLVPVENSAAMFVVSPSASKKAVEDLPDYRSTVELDRALHSEYTWNRMNYGDILLFSPNILHGNVESLENFSRWSFNCRFKSLWSPYNDIDGNEKELGSFYLPITTKAVTRFALRFQGPKEF